MKASVQIVSTPTLDTHGTSLVLHFDSRRYVIGSFTEGLQRACAQTGTRLLKVNECFITGRSEWSNTGGLIGMVLCLADSVKSSRTASLEEHRKQALAKAQRLGFADDQAKVQELIDEATKSALPQLSFFSPPNVNYKLATARRYVFRQGMPVEVHEVLDNVSSSIDKPYWADENINMWPMVLRSSASPKPGNPRKRSFEMLENDDDGALSSPKDSTEQEQHKLIIKNIVNDMFNSTWQLDRLFETRLADVRMPATIFVRNPDTHKIEKYTGPMPGGTTELPDPDLEVLVRKPWPSARVESLPPATPSSDAVSYIFRTHELRGKFDPKKASALKVPKGPAFSKLTAGESVENTDGEIIRPDQVLGPTRPGVCFAVIDLPDPTYIDSLISRPEWTNGVAANIAVIIWNCGQGVTVDERFKAFVARLPDAKHILSSPETCADDIAFDSSAAATARLQQVDKTRYRTPFQQLDRKYDTADYPANVISARRGKRVNLVPSVVLTDEFIEPPLDIPSVIEAMPQEVLDEAQKATTALVQAGEAIAAWSKDMPGKDVEIITLGTGSALPSKYRNVSSTVMRVPGWGSMLFDCGEGTLGQLRRAFTADELKQFLQELRIISISHMHADHHLGLVNIIKAWYEEVHGLQPSDTPLSEANLKDLSSNNQMLAVVTEKAMQGWLHEYAAMEDYGYSRIAPIVLETQWTSDTRALRKSSLRWYTPQHDQRDNDANSSTTGNHSISPADLGLADIQAVSVKHCAGARAVSLTWPDGFKASYSGDCRPSAAFSRIGKDSTVCIHEATFDDELQADAVAKSHSTTSEALRVAQNMQAKACVLTHFSQRYQKLPILERDTVKSASIMNNEPLETNDDEADEVSALEAPETEQTQSQTVTNALEPVKFKLQTDMQVCVAFDFMRVKVGQIAEMQYFTPALLKLFEVDAKADNAPVEAANGSAKKSKRRN